MTEPKYNYSEMSFEQVAIALTKVFSPNLQKNYILQDIGQMSKSGDFIIKFKRKEDGLPKNSVPESTGTTPGKDHTDT